MKANFLEVQSLLFNEARFYIVEWLWRVAKSDLL